MARSTLKRGTASLTPVEMEVVRRKRLDDVCGEVATRLIWEGYQDGYEDEDVLAAHGMEYRRLANGIFTEEGERIELECGDIFHPNAADQVMAAIRQSGLRASTFLVIAFSRKLELVITRPH